MFKLYKFEPIERVPLYIEELVSGLMFHCQIPEGKDLINQIGHGNEIDNHSALETWVMKMLSHPSEPLVMILHKYFADELKKELTHG